MANEQTMNDQMRVRREKMQELRDAGIDPFGHRFERDSMNQELHEKYGLSLIHISEPTRIERQRHYRNDCRAHGCQTRQRKSRFCRSSG